MDLLHLQKDHHLMREEGALMLDGFWTAEFGSSAGVFGGGVAVLQNGKLYGGDGGYFYVGTYSFKEKEFHATLEIAPFIEDYPSVFKTVNQKITLELIGSIIDNNQLRAQGYSKGMPNVSFGVKLTRRA
jgi:hypothetical protein